MNTLRSCATPLKPLTTVFPSLPVTGSNDTAFAVELSKEAEEMGADGLLLVSPYYNKASQKGLIEHYTYIADRVNIPIILYNVPSRTGTNIACETYKVLSAHEKTSWPLRRQTVIFRA